MNTRYTVNCKLKKLYENVGRLTARVYLRELCKILLINQPM